MPRRGKAGSEASLAEGAQPARRPVVSPEFIAEHKRRRIIEALAELCAEQGYEATRITEIVRRAGVARKTLYEVFSGKDAVVLAAFESAIEEIVQRVEASCAEAAGGWEKQVEAGLGAFLGYVAAEPPLARICLIEALSATPATTAAYEDALQGFVEMAQRALPHDHRLPETIEETLVGGVAWIVYQQLRRGEAERAAELLPELTEFMMTPYLVAGAGAATDGAGGDG